MCPRLEEDSSNSFSQGVTLLCDCGVASSVTLHRREQWFSNMAPLGFPGVLLEIQILGSSPTVSDSVYLGET